MNAKPKNCGSELIAAVIEKASMNRLPPDPNDWLLGFGNVNRLRKDPLGQLFSLYTHVRPKNSFSSSSSVT
jgi:hypothetical protein